MPKEKQYIPELRFPEFTNSDKWEQTTLGSICQITNGKANAQDHVEGGIYPLFDRSDNVKASNEFLFEDDAVIIPGEGMHFIPKYYSGKFNLHQRAYALINIEAYPKFIYYNLLRNKTAIAQKAVRSTVLSLRLPILQKFPIGITQDIVEQQKIADCLSSLDRLITLENEKLDALKDHKKGLLQSLFPAKGKKVPEKRFPEFENDGEWKEIRFDKMFDLLVTNSHSRAKLNYKKGKIKNIHYGDIHTQLSILFDIEKENVPFINENISVDKLKEEAFCKEGDLIFADASEDIDDIGKVIEIVNLNNEKLVSGLHTIHARQKELKMIVGFGAYLFSSETIKDKIRREAQGAKVLGLSKKGISRIKFLYSQNKKEQENILNVLSSVDKLIKNQGNKIEQLQEHKNGLMQRLFPKM